MNLEAIRQNVTGTILRFSIPAIIAMLLTSMITVIDGYFIGNYIGTEGIAAVNLGLPIIYLFLSVGMMVSVGGVAIAGMSYGSGDLDTCNQVFRQTIATTTAFCFLTGLLVLIFFEPMLDFLGAQGQVRAYFKTYYGILLPELIIMVINSACGMFIRSEGNPRFFMTVNLISVLTNIVLDYLFTALFSWRIAGIAAASLCAALLSLLFILYFFLRKATVYHPGPFIFSLPLLKNTLLNGSSEFIGEMSTGIAMFAYNYVILRRIGLEGVTAFTIVGYVSYLFSMIVVGFGQGSSPLTSFTFGAGDTALSGKIRRRTNRFVFGAGLATFLLMTACSGWYGSLFVRNKAVLQMIQSGMMIFMTCFFCSGINAITSFYFTSVGKAFASAVISLSRGLVILLACIFILPALFGMTGVWLAAPVTEFLTFGISLAFLRRERLHP